MIHDIDPEEKIDLMILKSKQRIGLLESAKIEATGVCSAFLVA